MKNMNDMNIRLSDMDWYKDGEDGARTRKSVEILLRDKAENICYIGYSEGDFDVNHMEELGNLIFEDQRIISATDYHTIDGIDYKEMVYSTEYGEICIAISVDNKNGEVEVYFADIETTNKIKKAIYGC